MSAKDYIPRSDAGVQSFTANFGRIVADDPDVYGLSEELLSEYNTIQAEFKARLTAAVDPSTRGLRTVFLKNESRQKLVALTRQYCQQISKMISITDEQKQELGITIRKSTRSRVAPPEDKPVVMVKHLEGRRVMIKLGKQEISPGKPPRVEGATIFYRKRGNSDWIFAINTSRTTEIISLPPSETGDTFEVSAFWSNPRKERGPMSDPALINLPAGTALPQSNIPLIRAA